nr:hypothetical protein [Tanacetum cinerariifolium]
MIADRQPAKEELGAEQVQVDAVVAAAIVEDVAEDVDHMATPLPPPHGISSPPQEPSSHPQQQSVTPLAPTQGEAFLATFQLETVKLKERVKKLEKTNKVKSLKLRRLRKVGVSRQIESSDDMEDVFNQGRMMNEDKGIELGVTIRDPEEELPLKTHAETPKVKDKGKGILVEAPKAMKKKDQIEMDAEYARKVGKGCSGVETPLFENMLQVREIADDVAQPTSPLPPSPVIPPSPPH